MIYPLASRACGRMFSFSRLLNLRGAPAKLRFERIVLTVKFESQVRARIRCCG